MAIFRYCCRYFLQMRSTEIHTRHPRLCAVAFVAATFILLLILAGCSTKKNTAASRNWQAFNTRYNVYYNGNEHYRETLKEMEAKYEDDYTRRLMAHPAEARADKKLPQPSGDFKRTIEKMQKSIQLHSIKKKPARRSSTAKEKAFRARDEFNPFLHNSWLMLGKAQFMNGDFSGAASTFYYIYKHFTWLPDVMLEARLWQARAYCAEDWLYEAEDILTHIKPEKIEKKSLRNLYDNVMGDYLMRAGKYADAAIYLSRAAKAASGTQKNRLWFLVGQAYSQLGDKKNAYTAFKKAASGSSIPYRAKLNARIRQSEVFSGSNIRSEVNSLRSMTRFERNKEYLDQIYYAIGNLYLSRGDTTNAIENYRLAVAKSTRNGIDKALAQLALGNLLYDRGEYVQAQPCYSEAVPQLPDNYPDYRVLKRRSDLLDQLATYAGNVQLQDSLLALSKLSEKEQLAVCERLVKELLKREKEEADAARREQAEADAEANNRLQNTNSSAPQQFQMNSDRSWYFYNTQSKNAGKQEFQRRWGARKNEDDWRRRNKQSFAPDIPEEVDNDSDIAQNDSISPEQKEALAKENDPHFPEYYMKNIPRTEEEINNCNDIIQEGLYNMGLILKNKLEDYPQAEKEFTSLDTRYPDNQYRLDVYYNMYMMAAQQGNQSKMERYRSLILADFPESDYAKALSDPDYLERLKASAGREKELYDRTYAAYLADDNARVHSLVAEAESEFPLSRIMPKFVFLDALAYAATKDTDKFKERLDQITSKWSDTDINEPASGMIRGLQEGKTLQGGATNTRGIIWDTLLSTNTDTSPAADGQPVAFERDPSAPHILVLAFPTDSVNAKELLYDVARYNFSTFTTGDFDLEQLTFGKIGIITVSGFRNQAAAERYRNSFARYGFELPAAVRPIVISKANFELLTSRGRSFEEYFRFEADADKEATEEKLLGPGMTTPSPDNPGDAVEESSEGGEIPHEGEEADPDEVNPEKMTPDQSTITGESASEESIPAEEEAEEEE